VMNRKIPNPHHSTYVPNAPIYAKVFPSGCPTKILYAFIRTHHRLFDV